MTNNSFYQRTANFFIILWAAVLLPGGMAYAAIDSLEEAVNKAGRQRMLTQKMLKEYTLFGMKSTYGNPEQALSESIILFETQLDELNNYIKSKSSEPIQLKDQTILDSLKAIESLWIPLKNVLSKSPDKNKVVALQRDLETLLKACHKSTLLIAEMATSSAGEVVNISGRQRMLSQRMAGLYMLKAWGIDDTEFKIKLQTSMEQFSVAHKMLLTSPLNTDEIKLLLRKVEKSYLFFEIMGKSSSGKFTPNLINKSAMDILKNMNTATGLYVSESNKN